VEFGNLALAVDGEEFMGLLVAVFNRAHLVAIYVPRVDGAAERVLFFERKHFLPELVLVLRNVDIYYVSFGDVDVGEVAWEGFYLWSRRIVCVYRSAIQEGNVKRKYFLQSSWVFRKSNLLPRPRFLAEASVIDLTPSEVDFILSRSTLLTLSSSVVDHRVSVVGAVNYPFLRVLQVLDHCQI